MMHKLTFDSLKEKFNGKDVEISGWLMYENNRLNSWMDIYDCEFSIENLETNLTIPTEKYDGLDVAMLIVPILINNYDNMDIELIEEPYL